MLDKAADVILKEGGMWAALLIVVAATLGGAVIFLYKEMRKGERIHRKQIEELTAASRLEVSDLQAKREKMFEERMKDQGTLILVLEQNSKANIALENSSNQRILAIEKLTQGFATLTAMLDVRDDRILDHLKSFKETLEGLLRDLRVAPR